MLRVSAWDEAIEAGCAGALFETWMLAELLGIDALSGAGSSAHFWRTSAGSEVGLVLERGGAVVGFEMKAGATVRWSDTRGLTVLRDTLGERFRLGIIAYLALVAARVAQDRHVGEIAALLGVDTAIVEEWERTAYEDAPLSVVRRLAEELSVVDFYTSVYAHQVPPP